MKILGKMLGLGDSTGVGIGASSKEDSIFSLLAKYLQADYAENLSVSGAQIHDLKSQLEKRKLKNTVEDNYDLILIQIGGNDIIRFHRVAKQKQIFEDFLKTLPTFKKLICLSVGDVGDATYFPRFLRPFHSRLSIKYHAMFEEVLSKIQNATYVNLHIADRSQDPFLLHPEIYLSADGLHPSSAGYKLWYDQILKVTKI